MIGGQIAVAHVLRWYRTPIGILTLLLLAGTAVSLAAGWELLAVLPAFVVGGVVFPYKLTRNRADFERARAQLGALGRRVDQLATQHDLAAELTALDRKLQTIESRSVTRQAGASGECGEILDRVADLESELPAIHAAVESQRDRALALQRMIGVLEMRGAEKD